MRVINITTPIYNNKISFKSSPSANEGMDRHNEPDRFEKKRARQEKPLPEWARKAMLFSLVFFAFKNDPTVQNLLNPYEPTQEELDKTEFVHDYGNLIKEKGVSSAFYQLSSLTTIEQPKIKALGKNSYSVEFDLDKQKIIMEMALDKNNKDTIRGRVKLGDRDFVKYTAIFPNDDKDEFKILIKDKNERKYIFGRDYFGELYQVRGNKKVPLNKKNVERYEDYQERLEMLDKWKFFTTENDFWRKANIVLIIFLLLNEMAHDIVKRKEKEIKKDDKKSNENP